MSKYSYLISQMTWSFTRLRSFEDCPYRFLLTYIYSEEGTPRFYAEFGALVHQLLADYYSGSVRKELLPSRFISGFFSDVHGNISPEIRRKFFAQGLACMQQTGVCPYEIVGIEKQTDFKLDGYPFTGFIDMLLRKPNGELIMVDHKSHPLKPRSKRKKPTKTDKELDAYLRQLYLYSVWVEDVYGKPPAELVFNCYRTNQIIREPFCQDAYEEAKRWALSLIHRIEAADDFPPCINFFSCTHLCRVHEACPYYEIGG